MRKALSLLLVILLFAVPIVGAAEVTFPLELSHEWAQFDMGATHGAAVQTGGHGYAWGYNYNGPIGNGNSASVNVPTPYHFGDTITAVSANNKTTAYINSSDELYLVGQIWYGTGGSSGMPSTGPATATPILLDSNVRTVNIGFNHIVYIKNDNTLWVYGENAHGQLGDGTTTSDYTAKQLMTDVSYAAAGDCVTAIVKTNGTLWMCGFNAYGEVGNNSTTDQKIPVQVLTDVFTVSVMGDHVCAIKNDGSLWTWGANDYGQLGNGNTTMQKKPVQVLTGVAQVSAGMYHTGVIKTDGTLWFCGSNYRGPFGSGTNTTYSVATSSFTQTPGQYAAVKCGDRTTAVLALSGQLYVAGENTYGKLGTGTEGGFINTLTPIDVWIFNGPEAPVTYTVKFVDWDGTVLKTEEVDQGASATAPSDPEREGYTFIGWDTDFSCVESDLIVTALYEPISTGKLRGDVNCDGVVDFDDISAFYSYTLNKLELTPQGLINADANEDGNLNTADITWIYKFILNLI